ncbi:MAG: magnesium chelatase, partial [Phycisphaerales bacterium]
LDPRPDAIFFLTDGEVPADTPALVRRLNDRIRPTVINTVAFGTEAGRAALEEIARDSDGIFRFVPTGGRR